MGAGGEVMGEVGARRGVGWEAGRGHLGSGAAEGGGEPDTQRQLGRGAGGADEAGVAADAETRAGVERGGELGEGVESAFGLELLATVHWVMTRQGAAGLDGVIDQTYAWNERKRQFTPRQIGIAVDCLTRKGWVGGSARPDVARMFG